MMRYTIIYDDTTCRGCGKCTRLCPNWKLNAEGKAYPMNRVLDAIGCNQDVASQCPLHLVTIVSEHS